MRTLISRRTRPLAAAVAAGVALTLGVAGGAQAADSLVLDHGHIDAFAVTWDGSSMGVVLKEDVTGSHVAHAPQDVRLVVKPEAALVLPTPVPASLAFLGSGGDTVYYLPQTQDQNLIWPGWSTEALSSADWQSPLQIEVQAVHGPGQVYLWQTGSFGNTISVLGGGYQLPGTISVPVNAHVHANWAFTQQGRYSLTVRAAGTLKATGQAVTSAPVTYTVDVGDVPAPVAPTVSITGLAQHYHAGDTVSLAAAQDPQTALDHYHWFTKAPGSDTWVIDPTTTASTYSFTATAETNGLQVVAKLYDESHAVVAESAPVTVAVESHGGEEPETGLSITGWPAHFHTGQVGKLTAVQTPDTGLTAYQWFTKAPGAAEWAPVEGATSASFGFIVAASDAGRQYKVTLSAPDGDVVAESPAGTVEIDDHGSTPFSGPVVSASLSPNAGSLVMSIADEDLAVDLGEMALAPTADRWVASGDLGPVVVTDTRPGQKGWTASARVRGFTTVNGDQLSGQALGWTPVVGSASAGQTVSAGAASPSNLSGGTGLGSYQPLASAPAGASLGTASLSAGLLLEAPTTLAPGTYAGMVILTLI